jgi:hypothetical protein
MTAVTVLLVLLVFVKVTRRGQRRRRVRRQLRLLPASQSPEYRHYIGSARWRHKCRRYYFWYGRTCKWPGCHARSAALHHLTYRHLGWERMRELAGLCRPHHRQIHAYIYPYGFEAQRRFLRTGRM